jgi:hypothetical protein
MRLAIWAFRRLVRPRIRAFLWYDGEGRAEVLMPEEVVVMFGERR